MQFSHPLKKLIFTIFVNNPLNLFFLTLFLFVRSFFETIGLVTIVPIMDLILFEGSDNVSKISVFFKDITAFFNLKEKKIIFLFFIIFSILSVSFILISNFFSQKIKYDYCNNLIKSTLENIYRSNLNFFTQSSQGKLINTFTREVQLVGDSLSSLSRLFSNLIQIFFFLLIPFAISVKSTFIIILILISIYSPFVLLGRLSNKIGLANTESNNNFFNSLQEFLSFYKNILSFGLQNKIISIIESKFKISAKNAIKSYLLDNFISNIFVPITIIGILLAYFFSDLISLTFSELSVVMASFYRMSSKSNLLIKEYSILNRSISSFNQINKINQDSIDNAVGLENKYTYSFEKKIFFQNISFSYQKNSKVLKNINLEINKGEKIGFFGVSGSGKSTAAHLLLRLIKPTDGFIKIDGIDIFKIKSEEFQNKVSYVSQENILLNQSIFENFKLIKSNIKENDLRLVCNQVNILDYIDSLPSGFNTILGERGSTLSGGQLQRLSIARALITKPEILVLDEATSALDKKNTMDIRKVLSQIHKKTNLTLIVISHNPEFLDNMDRVYHFSNGEVKV